MIVAKNYIDDFFNGMYILVSFFAIYCINYIYINIQHINPYIIFIIYNLYFYFFLFCYYFIHYVHHKLTCYYLF